MHRRHVGSSEHAIRGMLDKTSVGIWWKEPSRELGVSKEVLNLSRYLSQTLSHPLESRNVSTT